MKFPVGPEDVKIVEGQSGKGLQVVCACGCVNWNHIEMPEAIWACRNCGRVFTYNYPLLVEKFRALEKPEVESPAANPAT